MDRELILAMTNASFSYLNGRTLVGQKESRCTASGHWEPDLTKVECKGIQANHNCSRQLVVICKVYLGSCSVINTCCAFFFLKVSTVVLH